ncbi:MAG: lyase family protein, partial [Acidobacteria bacterium]|nr:lyase family protein [Acidobacteriota bacterium]
MRSEHDSLGTRDIPVDVRHGIHTLRALENFHVLGRPVHPGLSRAFGAVKLAAARTNRALGYLPDVPVANALEQACRELLAGTLAADIVVDALQGGAGTSTNMNVNEVLANRA